MPFRKPHRPHYYTAPTLPGFGRVGPWSTGATGKRLADAVEAWLRQVALSDPDVVRGIEQGAYSLREAYVAHKEGRLEAMVAGLKDPALLDCIRAYEVTQTDRRKLEGLAQLEGSIPKGARLSWLCEPKTITRLLVDARAAGKKTNSVHRSLYAAIKGLLAHELGEFRKREITASVQFTYEDDTRHVDATPEQLAAILGKLDAEVYDFAVAAMLTGIDVTPLLRLTPSSFNFDKGTVRVHDTKARSRHRVLELSEQALAHFRVLAGRCSGPSEPLFRINEYTLRNRWRAARAEVGLDLRIKDLRHVFANAWVDAGGSLHELGQVLGHTRKTTTLRYTARQARRHRDQMDRVVSQLGLGRHLRAVGE